MFCFCLGALPWDGTGVMTKKQTTDIFHLAKIIGATSNDSKRRKIFDVCNT